MSRALIAFILFGIAMAYAFTMLPGCSAAHHTAEADVKPAYTSQQAARSIATYPHAIDPMPTDGDRPWYFSRRDRGTEVIAGFTTPKAQTAATYTWDRQQTTSGGRVFDNFNRTTYRSSITETVGY